MGYERFIFCFWECPTIGWHACKVKKHFHCLKVCIYFLFLYSRLSNGSFNDSFFQTPPLLDFKLQLLVWWSSLLWLVYCVQQMSITECPSPLLSPQLGGKHPNSHGICVSPIQKCIDKALRFVHQHIALFFISTPSNNNDKHSLFIDTYLDNSEQTDIAVSPLDEDLHDTNNWISFLHAKVQSTWWQQFLKEFVIQDFHVSLCQSQIIYQSQLI